MNIKRIRKLISISLVLSLFSNSTISIIANEYRDIQREAITSEINSYNTIDNINGLQINQTANWIDDYLKSTVEIKCEIINKAEINTLYDVNFNINEEVWEIISIDEYTKTNQTQEIILTLKLKDTSFIEGENFVSFYNSNPTILIGDSLHNLNIVELSRVAYKVEYLSSMEVGELPNGGVYLEGTPFIVDGANLTSQEGVFRGFRKIDEDEIIERFSVIENTVLVPVFGEIDSEVVSSTLGVQEAYMKRHTISEIQDELGVNINTVEFLKDENKKPQDSNITIDLSINEDNSMLAWVEQIDDKNILYISAFEKDIIANSNMTDYFKLPTTNNELTEINGLEYLNTKNVTNMSSMFYDCKATTLDVSSFDISNVRNFIYTFSGSQATELDLSNWDTSSAVNLYSMFHHSQATKINVANWNTSNVTNISGIFRDCKCSDLDISKWDVSKVTNMSFAFAGNLITEADFTNWNTSNVTNMSYMFLRSKIIDLDISNFDTSKVTNMYGMFWNSLATYLDLSNFDTSNVTNMTYMFSSSNATTIELGSFDTSKVTNMNNMFSFSSAQSLNLTNFNTSNVTNMNSMFLRAKATSIDVTSFDTSKVTEMSSMFDDCDATSLNVSNFNTSNVISMNNMFRYTEFIELDLSNFDTSKVTNMSYMFFDSKATLINVDNFNTSNVINMERMFQQTKAKNIDLSSFNTSNVVDMDYMFSDSLFEELDLSSFNTSNVTTMEYMFQNTVASIDVSSFNTSNVTIFRGMFNNASSPIIDVSNFDTSNATTMDAMFQNTKANHIDVSNFNTSNVTVFYSMFNGSKSSIIDVSSFNTSNATDMRVMFGGIVASDLDLSSFKFSNNLNALDLFRNVSNPLNIKVNDFIGDSNYQNSYEFISGLTKSIDVIEVVSTPIIITDYNKENDYVCDGEVLKNSSYILSYEHKLNNLQNFKSLSQDIIISNPNEVIEMGNVEPLSKIDYSVKIQNNSNTESGLIEIENKLSPYVVFDTNTEIILTNTHNVVIVKDFYYDEKAHSIIGAIDSMSSNADMDISFSAITINPQTSTYDIQIFNQFNIVENGLSRYSNIIKHTMKNTDISKYGINYSYTGDIPHLAPELPTELSEINLGKVLLLPEPQIPGYVFSGWYVNGTLANHSFTMRNTDANITGSFTKIEEVKHNITFNILNPLTNKIETVFSGNFLEGMELTVLNPIDAPTFKATTPNTFKSSDSSLVSGDTFIVDKDYVFMLDYSKNTFDVSYLVENAPSDIEIPNNTTSVWGEELNLPVFNSDLKDFSHYQINDIIVNENNFTMLKEDIVIKVIFEDKKNVLEITENNTNPTNNNINLNISASDFNDNFAYIELPNGEKIYELTTSFEILFNGAYSFKAYYQNGEVITNSIKVNNIDKEKPIIEIDNNENWSNIDINVNIEAVDY